MTISSFYGLTVPATPDSGPDSALELGFKFKTTVNGWITHIRFYRAAANSGIHVVHLWNDGGNLATQTVGTETADAWNDVQLTTPIAVTAGTVYTAGYHTDTAHYSFDSHFFDADVTSGQLIGPSSASVSGNGLFGYGVAGTFPTDSFNNSNYGIDVFFTDTDPTAAGITATLTVTEAPDTLASAAHAAIAATSAVSEQPDTLAAAAGVGIQAASTVTEAPDRLTSASAATIAAGLTVTEADDTLTAHLQTQPLGAITATLAVTEAADTLVAHARVTTPGMLSTLSEIIPFILNDLVGDRVWQLATPDDLPRDAAKRPLPFIIWHRVGGNDDTYIEQRPSPSHRHARIQIRSSAPGSIVAERLGEAVFQAMIDSPYTAGVYGSPVGAYDAARKLYAPWQQFSIWFQPNP